MSPAQKLKHRIVHGLRNRWHRQAARFSRAFAPLTDDHDRLLRMENKFRGRTAFLLGNGPSVRPEDLDGIAEFPSFACNRFHLAYGKTRLRPTFTLSADRQMIDDFGPEIVAQSSGMVFLANPNRPSFRGSYVWLRLREVPSPFTPDVLEYVFPHGGSLIVALQLGYFLGIRKFVLYGVDHNMSFQKQATTDAFRSAAGEGNHFIKDYRSGKAWCPPWVDGIERAFRLWHERLEAEGGFLLNATRGGKLEVVPRIALEEALARAEAETRATVISSERVR